MKNFFRKLFRIKNKEVKMGQSEELTRRELEKKLQEAERKANQLECDAKSKENFDAAKVREQELKLEGEEWLKTQPKYKVRVHKLNGGFVDSQVFEASFYVRINNYRDRLHSYYYPSPSTYDAHLYKEEAKGKAEALSKLTEVRIGDLTILRHAIESFEIIEVKKGKS